MLTTNAEALKKLKFMVDRESLNFSFAKTLLPNCVEVEDWTRFYDYDAAEDYDNPNVFVAECIIEEAMNKIEMEEYLKEL